MLFRSGKEQKIRIEASSGLSEADIQRMVKEAEANAEADHKEKEKVEVHNQAEQLAYGIEKALKEHGDKVSAEEKANVQTALDDLRKVEKSDNLDEIRTAMQKLEQVSQQLAQAAAQAGTAGAQGAGPQPGAAPGAESSDAKEGPVDADFKEVD